MPSIAGARAPPAPPRSCCWTRTPTPRARASSSSVPSRSALGHGLLAWSADLNGHEEFTLRIRDVATGTDRPDLLERDLLRHGMVGRRALPLLHGAGPRHAPLPGVAPRGRDQAGRRRSHPRGTRRALQRRAGAHPQRALHRHHQRVQHLDRRPRPAVRRSARQYRSSWPSAGPTSSTGSTTGATGSSSSPTSTPPDFKVVTAPCDAPGVDRWSDLVPHEPGRRITQVEPFADHLVLHEWADARERIRILRADGSERTLAFDEPVHSVELDANPEYDDVERCASATSRWTTPPSVYEEDVVTGERRLLKRTPVLGDFDPAAVRVGTGVGHRAGRRAGAGRRRLAPEHTSRRNAPPSRSTGTGPTSTPGRRGSRSPGSRSSTAAVSGRSPIREAAASWAGPGTWTASCSPSATRSPTSSPARSTWSSEGYGARDRVTVRGGSAGGLLVGRLRRPAARAVRRGGRRRALRRRRHDDERSHAAAHRHRVGGVGRPPPGAVRQLHARLLALRQRRGRGQLPGPLRDRRPERPAGGFHEPAKWVAKLRALATTRGPLLLRTELGAGHGGPSGRYEAWRDEARLLTFVLVASGLAS